MSFSVVVPVYNAENTLEILFSEIKSFFQNEGLSFEVIFVFDCGNPNSWKALEKIKKEHPELVKIIHLSRNFGQHNATISGISFASGDYIVTMDEDLQQSPGDIGKLISTQKEGDFDVVYGIYTIRKHNFFRNFTSLLLKKLLLVGIPDLHKDYSSFRLIKSNVAKATLEMRNSYTFLDGYISWITTNCHSCIVDHQERNEGKSSYTLKKLINHSVNIFVTFSNLPLRLITISSFFFLLFSICYSIYFALRKIILDDLASGFPSTVIILSFGLGLIMFFLGILGEYLYRINLKTTKKPNYFFKKIE